MKMWINFKDKKPRSLQRIGIYFYQEGKAQIKIAQYIRAKTVLAEDFLDFEWVDVRVDYDEKKDCYWTPEGFYENRFATKINYWLTEDIIKWMPLPKI